MVLTVLGREHASLSAACARKTGKRCPPIRCLDAKVHSCPHVQGAPRAKSDAQSETRWAPGAAEPGRWTPSCAAQQAVRPSERDYKETCDPAAVLPLVRRSVSPSRWRYLGSN